MEHLFDTEARYEGPKQFNSGHQVAITCDSRPEAGGEHIHLWANNLTGPLQTSRTISVQGRKSSRRHALLCLLNLPTDSSSSQLNLTCGHSREVAYHNEPSDKLLLFNGAWISGIHCNTCH